MLAAQISVTNGGSDTTSGNGCSLVEAIINANSDDQIYTDCVAGSSGTDTIILNTDVTLTTINHIANGNNGLPGINTSVIIGGQGHTIERLNVISDTFRIFYINGGTLQLYNVTVSNGSAQNTDDGILEDAVGGGILNVGTLMLTNTTISGNVADRGWRWYLERWLINRDEQFHS